MLTSTTDNIANKFLSNIHDFFVLLQPKSKKRCFIDKKKAVSFQLVHRSQRDPLITDETAPQHVLVESKTRSGEVCYAYIMLVEADVWEYNSCFKNLKPQIGSSEFSCIF